MPKNQCCVFDVMGDLTAPDVRTDLVLGARQLLRDGFYDDRKILELAVDRMIATEFPNQED